MKIRIIAIGKIKENYLKSGIDEYLKRIKPYSQIEIIEVMDEPLSDNPNASRFPLTEVRKLTSVMASAMRSGQLISEKAQLVTRTPLLPTEES